MPVSSCRPAFPALPFVTQDRALLPPQAATAPLQNLSSKLVKSRHCLHATNLQCEAGRSECEKARAEVEANDAEIAQLEEQERMLKMSYVESKLAYEKMHAIKYAKQQELKKARQRRLAVTKEADSLAGTYDGRRCEWAKANEGHMKAEEQARMLSAKLEAIENDKDIHKRRAQQSREDLTRCGALHLHTMTLALSFCYPPAHW